MDHKRGDCSGWIRGSPYDLSQCKRCHAKETAATARNGGWSSPKEIQQSPQYVEALPILRPTCQHFGDYQSSCPCGDKMRDVHHCMNESTETTRCWRSALHPIDKDVQSCERCPHWSAVPLAEGITIAITEWQRPAALKRLLDSIATYLPGWPVEVEDTGGNLSAGRNRLYGRVRTKYLLMLEEDFVILPSTPASLNDAIAILDHDDAIAGVGGIANEPFPGKPPPGDVAVRSRGAVRWGHNFRRIGNKVGLIPSTRPMRRTPSGVEYRPAELILNFGIFRTSLFQDVPYDDGFPIHEHKEYFWRASRAGKEFAFLPSLRVDHIRDHPTKQWRTFRRRSFAGRVQQKHGFTFIGEV